TQPPAGAVRYDGAWTATRTCEPYEELPSQTASFDLAVKNNEVVLTTGAPGQPGYSPARGTPNDHRVLTVRGDGIAVAKRFSGRPQPVFFGGRSDGARFALQGTLGDRTCTLVLARR